MVLSSRPVSNPRRIQRFAEIRSLDVTRVPDSLHSRDSQRTREDPVEIPSHLSRTALSALEKPLTILSDLRLASGGIPSTWNRCTKLSTQPMRMKRDHRKRPLAVPERTRPHSIAQRTVVLSWTGRPCKHQGTDPMLNDLSSVPLPLASEAGSQRKTGSPRGGGNSGDGRSPQGAARSTHPLIRTSERGTIGADVGANIRGKVLDPLCAAGP